MKSLKKLTRRQWMGILIMSLAILFMGAVAFFCGRPLIRFLRQPDAFREWVSEKGLIGRLLFIGMTAFQVVVAIIPGEPFELAAGYAFGAVEGTVLSVLGILLGSAIIFFMTKRFGMKFVTLFFSEEKINSLSFISNSQRRNLLFFIIFFIPGTPKDLLSYAAGLTPMRFGTWMLIAGVARLPSLVTSTVCGGALGNADYVFAAIAFGVTLLVSGVGVLIYRHLQKKKETNA